MQRIEQVDATELAGLYHTNDGAYTIGKRYTAFLKIKGSNNHLGDGMAIEQVNWIKYAVS